MSFPAEEAWIQRLCGLAAGLRQRDKEASEEIDLVVNWMRRQMERRQSIKIWDPLRKAREDFAAGRRGCWEPRGSGDFWADIYEKELYRLTTVETAKKKKK